MCLKIRTYLVFADTWCNEVESRERSHAQDMLIKLAEEFVRRKEMVCFTKMFLHADSYKINSNSLNTISFILGREAPRALLIHNSYK